MSRQCGCGDIVGQCRCIFDEVKALEQRLAESEKLAETRLERGKWWQNNATPVWEEQKKKIEELEQQLADSEKREGELKDRLIHGLKLEQKLSEAMEVIRYYSDPEIWMIKDKHSWRKSSPKSHGDDQLITDYKHPNRDWIGSVTVGGKKAREFLTKHETAEKI